MLNYGIYIENGRVMENGVHTGLYTSRYYAKKYHPDFVAVKVNGGYLAMNATQYRVWHNQMREI